MDDDRLKRSLDEWKCSFASDPHLAAKVRSASAPGGDAPVPDLIAWRRALLMRPGLAAGMAAALLLVGFLSGQFFGRQLESSSDLSLAYRMVIDPLYRLHAVIGEDDLGGSLSEPPAPETRPFARATGLRWLQGELDLSSREYERVAALHADYEVSIEALFDDLLAASYQYRELDRRRMSNDVVDYFQIYELLQRRKRLSEASVLLTAELLEKVAEAISPEQRARFSEMVDQVYPSIVAPGLAS